MKIEQITLKKLERLLSEKIDGDYRVPLSGPPLIIEVNQHNREEIRRIVNENYDGYISWNTPETPFDQHFKETEFWMIVQKNWSNQRISFMGWMPLTQRSLEWFEEEYKKIRVFQITTVPDEPVKEETIEDLIEMMLRE